MLLLSKRVFSCANLTRAASRYQHHHYVMPSRIAASGLIYFFPLLVFFFLFFLRCGYEVSIYNEFISVCSFYFFLDLIPFFYFYFTFEVPFIYTFLSYFSPISTFLSSNLTIFYLFSPFLRYFFCILSSWWWICFVDLFWGFFGNEVSGNVDVFTFSGIVK